MMNNIKFSALEPPVRHPTIRSGDITLVEFNDDYACWLNSDGVPTNYQGLPPHIIEQNYGLELNFSAAMDVYYDRTPIQPNDNNSIIVTNTINNEDNEMNTLKLNNVLEAMRNAGYTLTPVGRCGRDITVSHGGNDYFLLRLKKPSGVDQYATFTVYVTTYGKMFLNDDVETREVTDVKRSNQYPLRLFHKQIPGGTKLGKDCNFYKNPAPVQVVNMMPIDSHLPLSVKVEFPVNVEYERIVEDLLYNGVTWLAIIAQDEYNGLNKRDIIRYTREGNFDEDELRRVKEAVTVTV